jgi:hypothetical protein
LPVSSTVIRDSTGWSTPIVSNRAVNRARGLPQLAAVFPSTRYTDARPILSALAMSVGPHALRLQFPQATEDIRKALIASRQQYSKLPISADAGHSRR